jgi:hypothetical protein
MAQRIAASELERLVNDDKVSDEELARYLKPATVRSAPFRPMLTFNERTVDAPPTRGILGLTVTALNERANRRRAAAFERRLAGGYSGPKILAEGDSWFLYPILLRDIVENLSSQYAVFSVAAAGDTLHNMAREAAQLESLIQKHGFDALLLSAGGNDIAGDPLQTYLRSLPGRARPAADYITKTYDTFLATAKSSIGGVLERLLERFPQLHIFGHGYDWPFPADFGLWLGPAFIRQDVPVEARRPVLRLMIDRYYDMLREIAAGMDGRYHVVDCRGTVGGPANWFDELHPHNAGFSRAADKFRAEIDKVLGIAASRGAATEARAARITWRPRDEKTGARTHSRVYPRGAVITIGRHADREIMLEDERISRMHATLTVQDGGLVIKDSSANGSYLDGKRISEAMWKPGQALQIGHYVFTLEFEAPPVGVAQVVLGASQQGHSPSPRVGSDEGLTSLRIVVSRSSIAEQPASTWAVGLFDNVDPIATRSAARAIDEHYDGYLSNALERRFVYGHLGSITTLPLPKNGGSARNLLLAGLGAISEFVPSVMEATGEAIARVLIATHALDLATIPMGGNCGISLKTSIESFLAGFLKGLKSDGGTKGFRSLALCEINPERYQAMVETIRALQANKEFEARGYQVAIEENEAGRPSMAPSAAIAQGHEPARYLKKVYLDVANRTGSVFDYALVGAPGAAIPYFSRLAAPSARLKAVLEAPNCPGFDAVLGKELADAFMPPELQQSLGRELVEDNGHIVIIHDGASAAVPWEASYIAGRPLALEFGLSRQQKPSTRAAAKLIQRTRQADDGRIRMLLVYDPTCDLIGTETEAEALTELFSAYGSEITALKREECTKEAVLAELMKGNYDLLHFAGHAGFTKLQPEVSGIVLANRTYLCASDLEVLPSVPRLIFLNACQSGRVRGAAAPDTDTRMNGTVGTATGGDGSTGHASLAEGLILRNVMQFIGTYWLVNDEAASHFAIEFYSKVLEGKPVGEAIRAGRKKLFDARLRDWANYLHFGEPGELLRKNWSPSAAQVVVEAQPARAVAETLPDPRSGEGPPQAAAAMDRGGLGLPISRSDAVKVHAWMNAGFGRAMAAAVQGTPFTVEHLCAIACQETAYFWKDFIGKLPDAELLQRCVLDASGDFPGTGRRAFPVNTEAFRARYGDDLTNMLVTEANKTRALRNYGAKGWVYKGYGIFQYDLQYILEDEAFFRERQWARFDICLAKAMGELKKKYAATGDVWRAIRAYNGSGAAAEAYARKVAQFHAWLTEGSALTS